MSEREEQPARASAPTQKKQTIAKTLAIAGAVFVVALVAGRYAGGPTEQAKPSTTAVASKSASADKVYSIPVSMSQAVLGPEDALVTLVQWCDFPDPGCKKAEPAVQALLKRYPNELRLSFRHFYLDRSSRAHMFSRAAFEQGNKFWEARALFLADDGPYTEEKLEAWSKQLGLNWAHVESAMDKQLYNTHLVADRAFAKMFDVDGPPAFFANGRRLQGEATEQSLEALIKSELDNALQLVNQGVEKKNVYAEVIKNGTFTNPFPKGKKSGAASVQ